MFVSGVSRVYGLVGPKLLRLIRRSEDGDSLADAFPEYDVPLLLFILSLVLMALVMYKGYMLIDDRQKLRDLQKVVEDTMYKVRVQELTNQELTLILNERRHVVEELRTQNDKLEYELSKGMQCGAEKASPPAHIPPSIPGQSEEHDYVIDQLNKLRLEESK